MIVLRQRSPRTLALGRAPCALLCQHRDCGSTWACSVSKTLCSTLDCTRAPQALIYMARVAMLHGNSQQLKDLASQLIVGLTWQIGEFRQILQYEYSTII